MNNHVPHSLQFHREDRAQQNIRVDPVSLAESVIFFEQHIAVLTIFFEFDHQVFQYVGDVLALDLIGILLWLLL